MKTKRFLFLLLLLVLSLSLAVTASAAEDSACATVQIGSQSTEYTSFEKAWNAAVDAAGSGKEVVFKLLKDWTANSDGSFGSGSGFDNGAIRYNKSKNITLDLNG
ncbi:MAG: hypothetical protein HUJ65_02750, partial [Oscillospiraceae bacterium]|nr:hypothetical protein [Oscillospiraceae bacterium]